MDLIHFDDIFQPIPKSIFKLWQGASIRANVALSVCGKNFRGKFVELKNQNSLIIFDYLINIWNCRGDRVTTKINSKAN